jgi:MFS superfamily sulfate permease-like transporter
VLIGFIHGVAIVLIAGQLGKLLGIGVDAGRPLPRFAEAIRELEDTHDLTIAIATVSLVALFSLKHWLPKVPGALAVVVVGIAASAAFDFAGHGCDGRRHPAGPPSFAWPGPAAMNWRLVPPRSASSPSASPIRC